MTPFRSLAATRTAPYLLMLAFAEQIWNKSTLCSLTSRSDEQRKHVDLSFSIGIEIDEKDGDKENNVSQVIWDSPAFKSKITEGARIIAVNGVAYTSDVLKDAIRGAAGTKPPIELIIKTGDRFMVANLDYHDGLRYPSLERIANTPAYLDDIFSPSK